MLSSHLGVNTFLSGVSKYLKAHAYGNATTEDLWSKLSEAAGVDVSAFMVGIRSSQVFLILHFTDTIKRATGSRSLDSLSSQSQKSLARLLSANPASSVPAMSNPRKTKPLGGFP